MNARVSNNLRYVDAEFVKLMRKYSPEMSQGVENLIAGVSLGLSQQHSCLMLDTKKTDLIKELKSLAIVGNGDTATPLVLNGNSLYLHRYFQYEKGVADQLIARNKKLDIPENLQSRLGLYFEQSGGTIDWQQIAAIQALTRQLTIITGGPGTGKTSTIVKILAILLTDKTTSNMTIKLAAPTGKAAMRLAESIQQFLPQLPEAIRNQIPTSVQTMHRLLGMRGNGREFRHNSHNPISADLLIVDEVSMVDLTLMYRLLDALPPHTRLMLLGDPEQLPSVDAGNVLADLCDKPPGYSQELSTLANELMNVDVPIDPDSNPLIDARCHFQKSYRFSADRGIGQLANMIRSGETYLASSHDDEVQVHALSALENDSRKKELSSYYFEYEMLIKDLDIDALSLLANFEQTRILCPLRDGELGVESLNREIESHLEAKQIKQAGQDFYHGRPIIITRNDYGLGLYNGDIGICILDSTDNQTKVAFLETTGSVKLFLATRLPPHETCFVMTVHKSQGSEFDHVTLIMPRPTSPAAEQLLTRELVYTAATRARNSIAVYSDEDIWSAAVTRTGNRMSGLASFLQSAAPTDEQLDLF